MSVQLSLADILVVGRKLERERFSVGMGQNAGWDP